MMIRTTIIAGGLLGLGIFTAAPAMAGPMDVSCSPPSICSVWAGAPAQVGKVWAGAPAQVAGVWAGAPAQVVGVWHDALVGAPPKGP
jgi:hypothetical protein